MVEQRNFLKNFFGGDRERYQEAHTVNVLITYGRHVWLRLRNQLQINGE